MTQTAQKRISIIWELAKGTGIGMAVFIGTGILKYQKMSYDWQIRMEARMTNAESSIASQSRATEGAQDKLSRHEKQITFIFARFDLPLIQN